MPNPFEIPLSADAISIALQNVVGADVQPISGSVKMVTSGGTYQQIQDVSNALIAAQLFESTPTPVLSPDIARTFTHNLGGTPKIIQIILRCTTDNLGYTVGDEIHIGDYGNQGGVTAMWANVTTIGYERDSVGFYIKNRNTTSYATINASNANWEVFMRAIL
jgi:hypothetical protein